MILHRGRRAHYSMAAAARLRGVGPGVSAEIIQAVCRNTRIGSATHAGLEMDNVTPPGPTGKGGPHQWPRPPVYPLAGPPLGTGFVRAIKAAMVARL